MIAQPWMCVEACRVEEPIPLLWLEVHDRSRPLEGKRSAPGPPINVSLVLHHRVVVALRREHVVSSTACKGIIIFFP